MSGPAGSQQWMYASDGFYPHEIGNSARLDSGALFTRTPSSSSNADTFTWSAWVKNWGVTTGGYLLSAGVASTREFLIYFDATNQRLNVYQWNGGIEIQVITSKQFRDPSAWYHIVVAYDSTQGTASNRIKIYVNGEQETSFASAQYPAQGLGSRVGTTEVQDIGRNAYNQNVYSDFYITEVNYISGSQLAPTSFGETKADTWIPKKYAGSYGSHDYYLPFNDAGFLGKDASTVLGAELVTNGTFDTNINNWTAHNGATLALSNNRLSVYESPGFDGGAYQAISVESGKTYSIEATVDKGTTNGARVGVEYTLGGRDGVETSSNAGGHFQFTFTPSSTGTVYVRCFIQAAGTAYFDNISVKEITTQGNDFTSTNVLVTDQMLDSPTNNFATINPLATPDNNANISFSQGNLRVDNPASNYGWGDGTIPLPKTGKWVFEVLFLKTPTGASPWCYNSIGVLPNTQWGSYATNGSVFYGIDDSGGTYKNFVEAGTAQGTHAGFPAGTIVQVFADRDNNQLTFSINGTLQTQTDSTVDIPAGVDLVPATGNYEFISIMNFGQDSSFTGEKTAQGNTDANGLGDFYYAPPAGFLALCSANMPDPVAAFNPAVNNSPQDHFNTVLWTGNGSEPRSITGVGFQPDFVWSKARNEPYSSVLYDVVRGTGTNKSLVSNTNDAEGTYPTYHHISSLDSDGFTIGATSATNVLNNNNVTEVAWNWKAGGSGVSNSDGTISSTVSANTDAGFSIVTYTGTGSAATVGHGLDSTPDIVMLKNRADTTDWVLWSSTFSPADRYLIPNKTNATSSSADGVFTAAPTSTVINIGSWGGISGSSDSHVAYCFHSAEGFSKFGVYTGNGSDDGPFIYTGFRPAWILLKRTDVANNWVLLDNKRDPHNVAAGTIYANQNYGENADYIRWDMLSNGFKLRKGGSGWLDQNASAGTYIYMAFAEMPFKYANAR